jgi:ketosteroid isomerase-like protein
MKRLMLIAALAVISIAATQTAKKDNSIERELMQKEYDWSAAYLKHDPAMVDRILADDYVGVDGRGIVSNRVEEIEEAKAPPVGTPLPDRIVTDETISDMTVRVYGNTAIVNGISTEKVQNKGNQLIIRYRRTTVYVKRERGWQCVSFHASRIQEPPK